MFSHSFVFLLLFISYPYCSFNKIRKSTIINHLFSPNYNFLVFLKQKTMEINIKTLTVQKATSLKRIPSENELSFGKDFTDHMFIMDYDPKNGWHNPRIQPYDAFPIEPGLITFHYGQTVFDGFKAYYGIDGKIRFFRVMDYLRRLNNSAKGLCIPEFNIDELYEYLKQLILLDKNWIPKKEGTSLYIRPLIIASDNALGVRTSNTYKMFIILSPVGFYYSEGFNPVKILVEETYSRTAPGGLGVYKTAANYASSLYGAELAKKKGFTQVLWLDACMKKYVEEVGTMNIFFRIGDDLITPPLEGTILPGITRDSIIKIAKDKGIHVYERKISIDEVFNAHDNGKLKEVFGSGTAAIISPVGLLSYKGREIVINNFQTGEWSKEFFDLITSWHHGKKIDPYGWITILED